ncbi:A/G-specific adenine glycosylase [Candidatus Photodesmus blepharus]|uniref:Adenine DNA glycosylase n=1 Tax=Candidatus Photodesmus blepharonis TaxID=1179155 RepID=A0A084CM32_9GAMM|nr:A/G-specific adenine glycosylase [Candidatus Photodesmus blepharus]KEY90861.1 A/G-specific adenine glycosylase [Candidatus Photodesmus blepharus]
MTPFAKAILKWYDISGRKNLPWQKNKTAYRVWLSEIMLQQTQVATVIPHYLRFLKKFPNIVDLANASQDEVLYLWSGLGYYARARNLYKTAQIITKQYSGKFPMNMEEIRALPGIGRSTAAAILSSVHKKKYAVLDGNVKRILTRYFAIGGWPGQKKVEKILWQHAEEYTPQKDTDKYNQAMMDIGATVCTRHNPKCGLCPISQNCVAYQQGNPLDYPSKKNKKDKLVKETWFIILRYNNQVWLEQRPNSGIWGGLFCFPENKNSEVELNLCIEYKETISKITQSITFVHAFSHYHLKITPILVDLSNKPLIEKTRGLWYNLLKPAKIGLAAPVKLLLEELTLSIL